jgi:hypothetical protein
VICGALAPRIASRTATDIRQQQGYMSLARHVRAFAVWIGNEK